MKMKNLSYILMLFLIACGPSIEEQQMQQQAKNEADQNTTHTDLGSIIGGTKLSTVKHTDGCDYVLWSNGPGSCMVHSGNCTNHGHKPVF